MKVIIPRLPLIQHLIKRYLRIVLSLEIKKNFGWPFHSFDIVNKISVTFCWILLFVNMLLFTHKIVTIASILLLGSHVRAAAVHLEKRDIEGFIHDFQCGYGDGGRITKEMVIEAANKAAKSHTKPYSTFYLSPLYLSVFGTFQIMKN